MAATNLDLHVQLAALLSDITSEIGISSRSRVYCNRSLKMTSIDVIGFDMDYTLALYHQERLEKLSIELTIENLIRNLGYPEEIRQLRYDARFAVRGLVVDRKLGNVFKMDRHGYVGRVYHGFRQLTKQERRENYRHKRINLSHARYAWIDTLFSLPEAVMYIALVDYFDDRQGRVDYSKLFADIRACIDLAHRDDSLKSIIKSDLPAYISKDPALPEMLHKLRSSGKRLFLLTNSFYPYTQAVMSYLLDGVRKAYPTWRSYFDIIIVGGSKPGFFTEPEPFVQLDPKTGVALPGEVTELLRDRIYQGGNIIDFERMVEVIGEQVLYIGDHIYGDILRLKKSHIWRTALVLQELERESRIGADVEQRIRDLTVLDRRRRNLESEIDYQVLVLKRLQKLLESTLEPHHGEPNPAPNPEPNYDERPGQSPHAALRPEIEEAKEQAKATLDSLRDRARLMHEEVDALESSIDRLYNPYWGGIFRAGHENSRFGEQVSDYADLYTSRVSNFLAYSPLRYFRASRRLMPHEL